MNEKYAVESGSRRIGDATGYYGHFETKEAAEHALARKGWVKSFAAQASDATSEDDEWVDPVPVAGYRGYLKVVSIGDLSRRTVIKPAHLLPARH